MQLDPMTWMSVRMLAAQAKQRRVVVKHFLSVILRQRFVSTAAKCVEAYVAVVQMLHMRDHTKTCALGPKVWVVAWQ